MRSLRNSHEGLGSVLWMTVGAFSVIGGVSSGVAALPHSPTTTASDYMMCTGTASMVRGVPTASGCSTIAAEIAGNDGEHAAGKLVGWAEVDLLSEFGIARVRTCTS